MELSRNKVEAHTSISTLRKLNARTMKNIETYSKSPALITKRIATLERESDVERIMDLATVIFGFIGLFLGIYENVYWFILTGVMLAFLALHAIVGWCPMLPLIRGSGKRTREEIDEELYALKVIRGDFRFFHGIHDVYDAVKKH